MLIVLKWSTHLFLSGTINPDLEYTTKDSASFAILKCDSSKPASFHGYIHK